MNENVILNVGFVTSSLLVRTGFSNMARYLIPYLFKTNKYKIFHLNQGISFDANLQKYPWENEGCLRPDVLDINRFNSADEGYKRLASYGNLAVEDFIIKNKIDVLILQEDGWAFDPTFYFKSKWYPYLKENVLLHTTIDSLNILPLYKEWAENCSNMWVWASFASNAMKQENPLKYGHVKHVFGCVNENDYAPISLKEKLELRKQNNIDPNTTLFIQLGRSQLRKLYPSTLESFGRFKKENPTIKAKLLFHCSSIEGWPFDRLIIDNGLKKEDVLFTHFCTNCGKWELKPLEGEYKDCKSCGFKGFPPNQGNPHGGGVITAGVTSTITNKDIAKIYGIADACVSPYTSGGFEYCNAESLLCGLPLLCTNYSSGEDFCKQDFVFQLDGTFTHEVGTGFKKHVPNINTMVKFYKKICEMPLDKRQEIGKRGREWAIKSFSINTIGPIFEQWIDSRKKIEWDYKYKVEIKNINAQIPNEVINHPDDKEFIKQCYKIILNMDISDEDSGLLHWMGFLKQPENKNKLRENLIQCFRSAGVEHNVKEVPFKFETLLDNNKNKRLLLVLKESIGDIFLSTAILESLKEMYSEYDIYYACDPKFAEILSGNPYIYKVIPYIGEMESEIWATGQGNNKGFFDVYINLGIFTQRQLNYLSRDKIAFNINK